MALMAHVLFIITPGIAGLFSGRDGECLNSPAGPKSISQWGTLTGAVPAPMRPVVPRRMLLVRRRAGKHGTIDV